MRPKESSPPHFVHSSPAMAAFGSLDVFLMDPVEPRDKGLNFLLGRPPRPSKHEGAPPNDGTLLNKKVAFKMLKQLGCEVRRPPPGPEGEPSGDPFIEVGVAEQPVLFRMLLEFGYNPIPNEAGVPVVRVAERQRRRPEEVVADLTQPKVELLSAEGWPSVGPPRPRLKPEAAEELVRRLAAPRSKKTPSEDSREESSSKEPPRFRSKEEQEASLRRLLSKRSSAGTEPEEAAPGPTAPSKSAMSCPTLWPTMTGGISSAPGVRRAPASSASAPKLRASPRLAQAGLAALSPSPVHGSPEPGVSSPLTHSAEETEKAAGSPRRRLSPEWPATTVQSHSEAGEQTLTHPVQNSSYHPAQEQTLRAPARQEDDWLDRLLGPPGRAKPQVQRTKSEQQEYFDRLAKPRQKPEEQEQAALAPQRSPRSQREACARLAVPRQQPKAKAKPAGTDETSQVEEEEEFEEGEDAPQVRIIPSLLARCPSQLEPIDEEAASEEGRRSRHRLEEAAPRQRRAKSHGASTAAPYAAKLLPRKQARGRRPLAAAGSRPSPPFDLDSGQDYELSDEEADTLTGYFGQLAEEAVRTEDQEMLEHIDQLYSSLLSGRSPKEAPHVRAREAPRAAEPPGAFGGYPGHPSPSSRVPAPTTVPSMCPPPGWTPMTAPPPASATGFLAQDEVEEDAPAEELLANIDRLYGALLQGGSSSSTAPLPPQQVSYSGSMTSPQGSTPLQAPPHAPAREPVLSARTDPSELRGLLEETLFSALFLWRGAGGAPDTLVKINRLLPASLLRCCFQACSSFPLPSTLLLRLEAEIPSLHEGLVTSGPCQERDVTKLLESVRRARDALLSLASSAEVTADDIVLARPSSAAAAPSINAQPVPTLSRQTSATAAAPTTPASSAAGHVGESRQRSTSRPRRSSMSYWTSESLDALEAPRGRSTRHLSK